ncbi:MAG: flavodoxin family protein [Thermodesulfobacteriota bacterium]
MKVLGINGSPRKSGNTATMLRSLFDRLEQEGIETELCQLSGLKLSGCTACYRCFDKRDRSCHGRRDDMNTVIAKMLAADAVVLASPTYFADLTPEIKAVMDRAGMVAIANDRMFARKVGAAVAVARRGGAIHTFDSLNHFFFINAMVVPGATYWNMGFALDPGEVAADEEAMTNMVALGENMAWLLKKIHA